MKLDLLSPEAIRSTDSVKRVTSLDPAEMKKTIGGAVGIGCFPCIGDGCFIYVDFSCIGAEQRDN